jgi:hypothetical protein
MKKYYPLDNEHATGLYKAIGETIEYFYPVGLSAWDAEYHEFPGIKELNEILGEQIGNDKNYKKSWGSFLKKLRKESDKQITSTTYGFVPGFSADLILDSYEDEVLRRVKRIAFAVSLIGPFYSICGIDETFIKDKRDDLPISYHAINVVTGSPYKEFETDFNLIEGVIKNEFPGYKLVPFEICMKYLHNVETLHSMGQEGTVYNALFNHLFNFYTHFYSRGDRSYGAERNPNIGVTLAPPPKN